jgi:hypothetical protein
MDMVNFLLSAPIRRGDSYHLEVPVLLAPLEIDETPNVHKNTFTSAIQIGQYELSHFVDPPKLRRGVLLQLDPLF